MWDTLPCELRRDIIKYNPSLKSIHKTNFKTTHAFIRSLRRDRQCLGCVRHAMFVKKNIVNSGLLRKPSVRMYVSVTMRETRARIYSLCEHHKNYANIEYGSHKTIKLPSNVITNLQISEFLKKEFGKSLACILSHKGIDEDLLEASRSEDFTVDQRVRPRWSRYSFV
jgi:hypothetical protein